ncbi:MAG: hypothetical protein J7577_00995 [Sphingobacteriaceae bacterium]|nr:hypothetical protein [Sphingobacteriaceae bacterium]
MKKYNSIHRFSRVTGEQMADILERYANGESFEVIAGIHNVARSTIFNYIHRHFYGIVPKHRQKVIIIQSAINEQLQNQPHTTKAKNKIITTGVSRFA